MTRYRRASIVRVFASTHALPVALVFFGSACTTLPPWEGPVAFIGAGQVYGAENFDLKETEKASGSDLSADGAVGIDLRGGYRFTPDFALEIQLQGFDDHEIDIAGGSSTDVQLTTFGLNAKFYTELNATTELYGLVGIGLMTADASSNAPAFLADFDDSAFTVRAGLGVEGHAWTRLRWFAEVAIVEPTDDLDGVGVIPITVGVLWGF